MLAALACMPASAAELNWPGRPFEIVASEKTLADLMRELAASQGTTAVVDPKINAVVSGRFSGEPLTILDRLCATYALSWYFDGAVLYVDPSADIKSEVMPITSSQAGQLVDTLRRLKIYDNRYPLLVSAREGTARVSGPRRYVELVRQAVKLVDRKNAANDTSEIRLFPLRYAWAADFKLTRSGKEVTIAGVAKVLRSLYGRRGDDSLGSADSHSSSSRVGVESAERQIRLASGDIVDAPRIDLANVFNGAGSTDETAGLAENNGELPQFQADTRMNAVLVRDLPERMAQYEKLIAAMDVRPRLIEIEVTIMDVQSDALDKLGVDWRARGDRADLQTGNGGSPALSWNSTTERGQTAIDPLTGRTIAPIGGVFTAAIGHELSEYLIARVTALAQKGKADMVARPKVLTLDNNEAVLENLKEFYIQVSGFQDAGLFRVSAGTSVRVTPLLVEEGSAQGLMMSINIQDDELSPQSVSSIPVIDRRTVNTQALIAEGTSLLIAGYSSEQKSSAISGVPLLSSIPGLGNLFKHTRKQQSRQERLYLLTPRLFVPVAAAAANPTPLPPALPTQESPSQQASPPAAAASSTVPSS